MSRRNVSGGVTVGFVLFVLDFQTSTFKDKSIDPTIINSHCTLCNLIANGQESYAFLD